MSKPIFKQNNIIPINTESSEFSTGRIYIQGKEFEVKVTIEKSDSPTSKYGQEVGLSPEQNVLIEIYE